MDPHVEFQFLHVGKDLAANVAHGHIARVAVHVQFQAIFVLVGFFADNTLIRIAEIPVNNSFVDR